MFSRNARESEPWDAVPEDAFVWKIRPLSAALAESSVKREKRHGATSTNTPRSTNFVQCFEVGRRLLLAQFTFSEWVLRRVEKVQFVSDRKVSRNSSIEFRVPDDAPIIMSEDGEPQWLIPLSVMRRRTLVNLDLRDEEGHGISLLGLRFTQNLDEAMLKSAARLARPESRSHTQIDKFIEDVVSGDWAQVQTRRKQYEDWRNARATKAADTTLGDYFANATLRATLERMWHNFTLYVTLPVKEGRHRVLRLGFEEQVHWRYQLPRLTKEPPTPGVPEVWNYKPMAHWLKAWGAWRLGHYIGWRSTRIRFLTPSAENCASYHFEFTAPPGLWVASAAFVGGRPNLTTEVGVTPWDSVTSSGHSAGLHAVEVPNGSLCRAQVNLRLPVRGWLSTLTVSCWAVAIVLGATAYHAPLFGAQGQWTSDQVTNIVLLLVTVCAAASTYVAQHSTDEVASRMLSGLRLGGLLALSLPAVAAVSLVFIKDRGASAPSAQALEPPRRIPRLLPDNVTGWLASTPVRELLTTYLWGLTVLAASISVSVLWALARSWADARRMGRNSPWDMTTVDEVTRWGWLRNLQMWKRPINGDKLTFHGLTKKLRLTKPAFGVNSAEGWHERYGWDGDAQRDALRLLRNQTLQPPSVPLCGCTAVHPRHSRHRRRGQCGGTSPTSDARHA